MFQHGTTKASTKIQSYLQTVLLQNNKLTKYPPVLFHIPSLKVVQIEGNPIGQSETERPEMSEKEPKNFEEGSDSGIASQEEEMSEKNNSGSDTTEPKSPPIEMSPNNEEENVRF